MSKSESVKVKKTSKKEKVLHNMQTLKKLTDRNIKIQYVSDGFPKKVSEIVKISKKRLNFSQIIFF